MIVCLFCEEPATYAYLPAGIVWSGCPDSVEFCKGHLLRYYLGLHYGRRA